MIATLFPGYGLSPPALFRPGAFVWNNSLFIVGGHTDTSYEVTSEIWRADIQAFKEAPEGMWRPGMYVCISDPIFRNCRNDALRGSNLS